MAKETDNAAAKLETLARHLRAGWKKLYPVSEENLKKVSEAVQRQWDQQQSQTQKKSLSKGKSKSRGHDQAHEY
jgi:hypothetical protein